MNIPEVTLEQFRNAIKLGFLIGQKMGAKEMKPILGLGKPGIGKTEGLAELCKELGCGYMELQLAGMSEADLLGMPFIETLQNGQKVTDWASNCKLPLESRDGKYGILVLDEIASCSNAIRTSCLQLLDNRRSLANYKLPDGWLCVALGNGEEDGGDFQGLEGAFLDRFTRGVFHVNCDAESWTYWAVKNDVNPSIVAFINFKPERIHSFDPMMESADVFASPRSWTGLGQMLNYMEEQNNGKPIKIDDVDFLVRGAIGNVVGDEFVSFYKYSANLMDADDILAGKVKSCNGEMKQQELLLLGQTLLSRFKKLMEDDKKSNADRVTGFSNMIMFLSTVSREDTCALIIRECGNAIPNLLELTVDDTFISSYAGQVFAEKFMKYINKAMA